MKEAMITTALVMFAAIMFLIQALWEPAQEAEERVLFNDRK